MIRRLNYTGRRKIPRSSVTVRLIRTAGNLYAFSIDVDLAGCGFPAQLSVFVEAYNATSYMRFDFGAAGEIHSPVDTRLTEITASAMPKFRLKIVERAEQCGRLLGVVDKLIPLQPDEDVVQKQSLLAVDYRDLEDQIWRLDLTDWPVLELNNRIDGIGEIAYSNHEFLGLVYPEVVRRILREIVLEQEITDPNFDDSEWTTLWLRYVCNFPGVEAPPEGRSEEARARQIEWIERAVAAFCHDKQARMKFQMATAQGVD